MTPRELIENALKEGRTWLYEDEAKLLCSLYEIPVAKSKVARSKEEAIKIAKEIGFPIVMKIVSPDVLHKSDVGGVKVNVKSEEELIKAYDEIVTNVKSRKPDARIVGILIQEMVPQATEVIIGGIRDPQFGPAVMFGLGGIFVEIFRDVSFRIAPVSVEDALEMISEIKGYQILKGYRGTTPADLDALADAIVKTSKMLLENEEIDQLDLNPVFVFEKGIKVIDARVILKK
ncbi:MAG: acetyl-CoA synthetase [Thermoprotei archaeon]|nr:MAG: acetyl-CoA synthetase [Thermoprotei archaeon]